MIRWVIRDDGTADHGHWNNWARSWGRVSHVIFWLCVAVFLSVTIADLTGVSPRHHMLTALGLSYEGIVHRHWYFQLITAPLTHANLTHLLFNMLSLWMLGSDVELRLGRSRYLVFSALCAATSMLGFLFCNWGTGQVALGYSGVIYGILVAQAMYFPNRVISFFAFFPIRMKYAVVLMAGVELFLTVAPENGGVAHAAHLFGAVAAFLYLKGSDLISVHAFRRIAKNRAATLAQQEKNKKHVMLPWEL